MSPPGMLATRLAGRLVVLMGAMPGRQGRMSGTPPPRSSPRRTQSSLTAGPGPRLAGHGRWRRWGRAFGACCFAGKLRSLVILSLAALGPGGLTPTSFPTSTPTSFPTRGGGVPLLSRVPASVQVTSPLGGSGAARPGGALRAIDRSARPRSWADLRSAPPKAAISACPGCHAGWCGMREAARVPLTLMHLASNRLRRCCRPDQPAIVLRVCSGPRTRTRSPAPRTVSWSGTAMC
jgi:hypothetical protein